MRIWRDGTVLDDYLVKLRDVHNILETLVKEINLKVERPSLHILIEVRQIWIIVY